MPTTFREAVEIIGVLQFHPGLQALRARDRERICVTKTRRISGSVDIDTCLKSQYPNDPRWDYAIGYTPAECNQEKVYWIEVHPATEGAIAEVIQKQRWLIKWLEKQGKPLHPFSRCFIWISSSNTGWNARSPQSKQLASEGILYSGTKVDLDCVRL
jgi:hypothetical protein